MASVNKVIIVGNLGREPEVRYMPSGDAMATVAVATTDKWKDKSSGEQKEATEWHRIVFFGKLAEIVGQYLKKGSALYVEGKLRTRKWTDKDNIERYTTEIVGDSMQMLGGRDVEKNSSKNAESEDYYAQSSGNQRRIPPTQSDLPSDMDDDLPF